MAVVTGTLTDITGGHLAGKNPEVMFTLNAPNTKAAGILYPTEPAKVTPASNGAWTVNLATTPDMMDNAHYTVAMRWLDAGGNYVRVDFPHWELTVPSGGGQFADLFGKPPTNHNIVYVSLVAPADPRPFMMWLEQNPDNPADPLNTGRLYQWSN